MIGGELYRETRVRWFRLHAKSCRSPATRSSWRENTRTKWSRNECPLSFQLPRAIYESWQAAAGELRARRFRRLVSRAALHVRRVVAPDSDAFMSTTLGTIRIPRYTRRRLVDNGRPEDLAPLLLRMEYSPAIGVSCRTTVTRTFSICLSFPGRRSATSTGKPLSRRRTIFELLARKICPTPGLRYYRQALSPLIQRAVPNASCTDVFPRFSTKARVYDPFLKNPTIFPVTAALLLLQGTVPITRGLRDQLSRPRNTSVPKRFVSSIYPILRRPRRS